MTLKSIRFFLCTLYHTGFISNKMMQVADTYLQSFHVCFELEIHLAALQIHRN